MSYYRQIGLEEQKYFIWRTESIDLSALLTSNAALTVLGI